MQAGVNLYQYCRGSPIGYTDPSGTTEQPTTGTFDGTQSGGQGPPPPEEDWERQARESREPIEAYESARPWWRLEEATRYVAEEALGSVTNTAGTPTSERDAQWSPKSKTSAEYGLGVLSIVGPGKLGALFKEAGVLTKIFGGALVGSTTAVGVQALGDAVDGKASSAGDYGQAAVVGGATGALTGAINGLGRAISRWLSVEAGAAGRAVPIAGGLDKIEGRLGGELFPQSQLPALERYLGNRSVSLHVGDDLLPKHVAGGFNAETGQLFLRSSPTRYEVQHELSHFIQARKLGLEAYSAQSRGQKEQFVYDMLSNNTKRWAGQLNEEQREHASGYILRVGGIR